MVVLKLISTDCFAYEQGLGLALTVADLSADFADMGSVVPEGVAPIGAMVYLAALPAGADAERTLKRLKQLELFEVPCVTHKDSGVMAALPFVKELSAKEVMALFASYEAQHATFLSY